MQGHVLVASRDDHSREQVLKLLSRRGIVTQGVREVIDLLLQVLERDYRAVIYDLGGSTIAGLKVVKILRKVRPKMPLVVLSEDHSRELGGKILQEGVAYYGVKPFEPEAFQEVVCGILGDKEGQPKISTNSNVEATA